MYANALMFKVFSLYHEQFIICFMYATIKYLISKNVSYDAVGSEKYKEGFVFSLNRQKIYFY